MEEERRKKIFLMRVGVTVLAVLILVFWGLNLRGVWRSAEERDRENQNQEWQEIKTEMDRAAQEVNAQLDDLKSSAEIKAAAEKIAVDEAKTAANVAGSAVITDLVERTKENSVPSSEIESLVAPAGLNGPVKPEESTSCPVYINCMPMIREVGDEISPCVIPVGCEEITQIVY